MELSQETKQALSKVLEASANTLSKALESGEKLVKENAPELVKEVIAYEGYVNCAISLVTNIVVALIGYYGGQFVISKCDADGSGIPLMYGIGTVFAIAMLIWFMCTIQELLKVKFAPRLFLISYAANLVKPKESSK